MKMFDKADIAERIGTDIKKSKTLHHLKDVEKYFIKLAEKHRLELEYDVVAMEIPYFKTIAYTEYCHSFMIKPLNNELRCKQWADAYADQIETPVGYMEYFRNRITGGNANKYEGMKDSGLEPREAVVVLVGSNKLKDFMCLNKMIFIKKTYKDDVYFKPHPLTTHQLVGELRDILGEDIVLDRGVDLHSLMIGAEVVYTTHLSESAMYAVALKKRVEPVDVYNKIQEGSFYHINKFLLTERDPYEWADIALRSPKCGLINPEVDENWEQRMRDYFEYIMAERERHKHKYVLSTGG